MFDEHEKIVIENVGDGVIIGFENSNGEIEYSYYTLDDGGTMDLEDTSKESVIKELSSMCDVDPNYCEIHCIKHSEGE